MKYQSIEEYEAYLNSYYKRQARKAEVRKQARLDKEEAMRRAAISPGHPDWTNKPWKRTAKPTNPSAWDHLHGKNYGNNALRHLRSALGVGPRRRIVMT